MRKRHDDTTARTRRNHENTESDLPKGKKKQKMPCDRSCSKDKMKTRRNRLVLERQEVKDKYENIFKLVVGRSVEQLAGKTYLLHIKPSELKRLS